jgi:hypothetical protein
MLTSRRDYILRIIDEVSRILARVVFKRNTGDDQEALGGVVVGLQRLFQLDGDQVFLLTPDEHYDLLIDDGSPEDARDKVLMYAALNVEAAAIYAKQGKRAMARATRLNALRFTLRSQLQFPRENLPSYAPAVSELLAALADEPLDPATAELVKTAAALPPLKAD